jgi:hypothetical protein
MSDNPNNIVIGYRPDEFFYKTVQPNLQPSDDTCNSFKAADGTYDISWDEKCGSDKISDNSFNCMERELCKNKDYSQNINSILTVHSEAGEKLKNSK